MLRNCVCLVIAHMVDATQLCLSCHCTHGGCYATVFVLSWHTWWMLRNCVCLVIAHMVDATQLCLSCHCTHGGCYATGFCLVKRRGNSVLNPRLWDYVYQFVYRHNKDLWETTWRSKTTFCVVVHISRTSYKNRKTSDCVVNHMILDYANVWHHRASRRRVTLFFPLDACMTCIIQIRNTMTTTQKIRERWQFRERTASGISS